MKNKVVADANTLAHLTNKELVTSSNVIPALEAVHGPNKQLHGKLKVRVGRSFGLGECRTAVLDCISCGLRTHLRVSTCHLPPEIYCGLSSRQAAG